MLKPVRHHNQATRKFIEDLDRGFQIRVGDQLRSLQAGERPTRAKSWHGNGWTGFEITMSAIRIVGYCAETEVLILHAFKKDAAEGRTTRKHHVDLIEQRYKQSVWRERQKGRGA